MALPVAVSEVAKAGRVLRRPHDTFSIRQRPFIIQPMMIAPVLPGETLKSLNYAFRAVTDPIKNPVMGWWYETFFFYVKLSDLYGREDFREMLLTPGIS